MAKSDKLSTWVFDSFDFKWDEESMIRELLGWSGNIFSWINLWIIDRTDEWKSIIEQINWLKEYIKTKITRWGNIPKAPEVEKIINKIALKVEDILINSWFWIDINGEMQWAPIVEKITNVVSYRTFVYWVLKVLWSTWFKTKEITPVDVPNETWKVIYDILRDPSLTTLLIVLKSYEVIKLSDNKWNEFANWLEEEVKICNIGEVREKIIAKLKELGAEEEFRGIVQDIYYDYPDKENNLRNKWWIKSTFRIRKKTPEGSNESNYYYTIKREITEEEKTFLIESGILKDRDVDTRICKEQEYEIDYENFKDAITRFWLIESKTKEKFRESYVISEEWKEKDGIKFDIDKYPSKQYMIEIEASMAQSITEWLKTLELDNEKKFPRMVTWSTKFMANKDTNEKPKK